MAKDFDKNIDDVAKGGIIGDVNLFYQADDEDGDVAEIDIMIAGYYNIIIFIYLKKKKTFILLLLSLYVIKIKVKNKTSIIIIISKNCILKMNFYIKFKIQY